MPRASCSTWRRSRRMCPGPDTVQIMSSLAEMEKQEGCDPEGVSAFLREFADRGSGGGGECAARQEGRAGREVLSGRGQQVGAGRSGEARHLADAARRGRAILCLRDADRASAWEWDCWSRAKWEFPPPTAISRDAWDRATPSAISPARRWWRRRRWPDTFAGHFKMADRTPARSVQGISRQRRARRKSKFFPAFPSECGDGWCSCRRTMSTPMRFTARTTPTATTSRWRRWRRW